MNLRCRSLVALAAALWATSPLLGQDANSVIEQSRLFQNAVPTTTTGVNANGVPLPISATAESSDGSFGAQQILKTEEKIPQISVGGDASVLFTNNVALTRRNTIEDVFFVGDAALSWTPWINHDLQLQTGVRASVFRYHDTPELDFQSIGTGIGVVWTPRCAWGIALIARYDFTELIDRHSDELLQDHEFSLAMQKIVPLGRAHALSFGAIASVGISDPFAQQRDQIGGIIGYHVQLTRRFDADLSYRHSWYFYNAAGRNDLNQILALGAHYHLSRWASLEGFLSWATNYSTKEAFRYEAFTIGGGVGLVVRF